VGLGLKGLRLGIDKLSPSMFGGYFQIDPQFGQLGCIPYCLEVDHFGMLSYLQYLFNHDRRFFKVEIGVGLCLPLALVMTL
jgi:hypothetical protein